MTFENENKNTTLLLELEKDLSRELQNLKYNVSLKLVNSEISISAIENNILFVILATIYAVLPVFWFESANFSLAIMIVLYYTFFILFITNLSRRSRKVVLNITKKTVRIENNNILGQFLFRKKIILFSDIIGFKVNLERVKGRGICEQISIITGSRSVIFIEYKTDDLTKERGNRITTILKRIAKQEIITL